MAKPHVIVIREIRERLKGKRDSERIAEIQSILGELSGYRSGPYGDIRRELLEDVERTRRKGSIYTIDSFQVPKQGLKQIALVGAPNAGKSSLLCALTNAEAAVAPYAFTTKRPIPGVLEHRGIHIQLVEVPGLIENASEGRGMGGRLLATIRNADGIAFIADILDAESQLGMLQAELRAAAISYSKALVLVNKCDTPELVSRAQNLPSKLPVVPVSALNRTGLDEAKEALCSLAGLIRVYCRRPGSEETDLAVLEAGAAVKELAERIHKEIAANMQYARVWGSSAKFAGQQVGPDHRLEEGDVVEICAR